MPIHKRTYPSGKTTYQVDYRDAQGIRKYKACPTLAHARNFEAKVLREKFEEKELGVKASQNILWEQITKNFLNHTRNTWTENTYKLHTYCLKAWNDFLKEQFPYGSIYLSDIDLPLINNYKTHRRQTVKNSTINRELTFLKTLFNWAIDSDEYHFESILPRKIKLLKEDSGRLRYLTEEEIATIIKEAPLLHLKVYYILAFSTGMRKGEILGLKWQDVDLLNGFIYVQRTGEKENTKSGKPRGITVDTGICDVLQWWKEQIGKVYKREKLPTYYPPVDDINVFTIKDIKKSHKTACKNAGIEDFRPHDCRHTAATLFRRKGTKLDTLMEILGHSTIRMTMRYAHVGSEEKRDAAEAVGYLIATQKVKDLLMPLPKPSKNE